MKASHDGIFDWNLETDEIYYSPGWKNILGYEEDELPNELAVWEKATYPEDVKRLQEHLDKLITKQYDRCVAEFKMKHKGGHWVDILCRADAVFNESGKTVRIVGTNTDITERKHAEELLRKSEAIKNTMISNIGDVLVIIDQNGINKYKSPNVTKYFGWTPEELVGKNTFDHEHPDFLETAQTPSYPSGHTAQAYYTAIKLSAIFPQLKDQLFTLAKMIEEARIDRGVHFPSDNTGGIVLAQKLAGLIP